MNNKYFFILATLFIFQTTLPPAHAGNQNEKRDFKSENTAENPLRSPTDTDPLAENYDLARLSSVRSGTPASRRLIAEERKDGDTSDWNPLSN